MSQQRRIRYLDRFMNDHFQRKEFFEWCAHEVPRLLYVLDEWTLEFQASKNVRVRSRDYPGLILPAIHVPPSKRKY